MSPFLTPTLGVHMNGIEISNIHINDGKKKMAKMTTEQ